MLYSTLTTGINDYVIDLVYFVAIFVSYGNIQEEFEDTKEVNRIRNSKKYSKNVQNDSLIDMTLWICES